MTSPILHYAFIDSDLGKDSSSSGVDLTNTDVTLVTDGDRGPVASFNGTTSYLVSPSNISTSLTGTNARTFMYWVKYTNLNYMRILHYGYGNPEGVQAGDWWMPSINNTGLYQVQVVVTRISIIFPFRVSCHNSRGMIVYYLWLK